MFLKLTNKFNGAATLGNYGVLQRINVAATGVCIYLIFFMLSLLRLHSFSLDETVFHYPNVINFYNNGLSATFNTHYSAANTPLPYIIIACCAKIFGASLLLARVITLLFSIATFLLTIKLVSYINLPAYSAFAVMFFPYFFVYSFVFYAINFGLFFFMLAMLLLQRSHDKPCFKTDLFIGVNLSLAVLCQQFYLVVPLAVIATRYFLQVKKKSWRALCNLQMAVSAFLLLMPLAMPAFIFYKWHGLTHPRYHEFSPAFSPDKIVAILFVTGFYFFVYVLQDHKTITRLQLLCSALVAITLSFFFKPLLGTDQGAGLFTGITLHSITVFNHVHPLLPGLLMSVLAFCGCITICKLSLSAKTYLDVILFLSFILLFLGFIFNAQTGERHLLSMMIILFLLILPRLKAGNIKLLTAFMVLAGVGYFIFWSSVKFHS